MSKNPHFDFSHLTVEERVQLAQDLWDSIPPEAYFPITEEQRAELDRRLEEIERNPDEGLPWEVVEAAVMRAIGEVRQARISRRGRFRAPIRARRRKAPHRASVRGLSPSGAT